MKLAQFYLGNVDPVNPQIAPVRMLAASPTISEREETYTALATAHLSLFRTNSGAALDYWFSQPDFYTYALFRLQPSDQMPYAAAVGSLIRPQQANPRSPYLYRYVLLTAEDAITLSGDWGFIAAAARPDEADLLKRIQPKHPARLDDLEVRYTVAQAEAFQARSLDLLDQYFGDRSAALTALLSTSQPVIVQNLPDDDQVRTDFAVALAAIWPPSLRSLVSFGLRVPSVEEADVQFKFLSSGQERQIMRKSGALYDFATGTIQGGGSEPSPYLEQVLVAMQQRTLISYQMTWDETAARLFRHYGDVDVALRLLNRWAALEDTPDEEQWAALLDADQSLTESARADSIQAMANWLQRLNRRLPENLLDVAKHYPGTERIIQTLLTDSIAEEKATFNEALWAQLHGLAETNPSWEHFVEALITNYSRRIDAGDSADEAYRLLREFGDADVMSLEALEVQVRQANRLTSDHARLLLQVALRRVPTEQLARWIADNPGWIAALPPERRAVFDGQIGVLEQALNGLPDAEQEAALIKLGELLRARGQIRALTEPAVIGRLLQLAAQDDPAARGLIDALADDPPDDDTRYRLLWWYAQFVEGDESWLADLLPVNVDPAALVDRLLAVDAGFAFSPHDNACLAGMYTAITQLDQREFALAVLRRTLPNWQRLELVIQGVVSALDTEDRLTEWDGRLIDSGLPTALLDWLMRRDSPTRAKLLAWWVRIFGIELAGGQENWNRVAQWLRAAHPAIEQNSAVYAQYVGQLQQRAEGWLSTELAQYLRLQFDSRMMLERQWLQAIITAGRVAAMVQMAKLDDLPLRLLKLLYEWQTETEIDQAELIAAFGRQVRIDLSHAQRKHLRSEIEAYIVVLEALAKPAEVAAEPKSGVNRLIQRVLQPMPASITFPLLRQLAAALAEVEN